MCVSLSIMGPGWSGQGGPRGGRVVPLFLATAAVFFAATAAASAATYFVSTTGVDPANDCTDQALPCLTITHAIGEHRAAPQPDDVIRVDAGDYAEDVDASSVLDDGLTIRGTLSGGTPATTISGDGPSPAGCADCIVALGLTPTTNVTLENVDVTQDNADLDLTPILLDGGSDLDTVGSFAGDANTFAAVELCTDPGSDISNSLLVATGNAAGIDGCAEIDIVDTRVFTNDGPTLNVPGTPGETTEVTRSWLSAADGSPGFSASVDGSLTIDSSLVTGAAIAVDHIGAAESDIVVNNSTLDAGTPGVDDGDALSLGRAGTDPVDATVDSSILVDRLLVDGPGAPLTLTCLYSNITNMTTPGDPDFTNDCPPAAAPGSTNTDTDPGELFEDPLSGDWSLRAGSPAIDGGEPGPVPPGLSTTDFDGDARRVAGTTATCPDGIRDQGAFEHARISCQRTLSVATSGTGSGTVTGPGIDCGGAGHTDCSETVALGSTIELTAAPADGSSFDGFSGGGCSTSPCAVTMDTDKSVQALFTDTRSGRRTLTIATSGNGSGTVTGPGIDCGGGSAHTDCSESYPLGEQVVLDASAKRRSVFDRFTGAGCDAAPCTVTMDSFHAVVGRFINARTPRTSFAARPHRPWPRNPVFRMRSTQPRSTFECNLDGEGWEACERRVRLRGLDPGRHRFRARATNRLGVTSPRPARARFRVPG